MLHKAKFQHRALQLVEQLEDELLAPLGSELTTLRRLTDELHRGMADMSTRLALQQKEIDALRKKMLDD